MIWLEAAGDRALLTRIRGQVSDLELELSVVQAGSTDQSAVDAAIHLSAEPGALALVWFERDDAHVDRVLVHVSAASGEPNRAATRQIGAGAVVVDGLLSSATLEAAALFVREALRELARGDLGTAGTISRSDAASDSAPRQAQRAKPASNAHSTRATTRGETEGERAASSALSLRAELDWLAVLDARSFSPRSGPFLSLGGAFRTLELSGFASTSLLMTEEDRYGVIRLRRTAFGLRVRREWRLSRAVSLDLGLLLGIALYARGVERLAPGVRQQNDHSSASGLIGPELRLGWAPGAGHWQLGLMASVSAVPTAPRSGYEVDGNFQPTLTIWRVQPSLGFGLRFSP